MKNTLKFVAILFVITSISVWARPPRGKMSKGMGVCKEDMEKFCKDVPRKSGKMHACLDSHIDELSEDCKKRHSHSGKQKEARHAACKDDISKHCAGVKSGDGKMRDCLKENKDKLSDDCKKAHNF